MSECLTATVSREYLTLPPLTIGGPADALQFDGASNAAEALTWDGDRWDRRTADSPWVHGDVMVGARLRNSQLGLALWAVGDSAADVKATVTELRAAAQQWSWTLVADTGAGTTWSWSCWLADMTVEFDRRHVWMFAAHVQLTVPCLPTGVLV